MVDNYQSWGQYPKVTHDAVHQFQWRHQLPNLADYEHSVLPYGLGRSYGDSCLNEGGALIDITGMDNFISFNEEDGLLCVEGGTTIAQILDVIVPRGFFIPVSPGTKFVTMGGAIANDVHGKNHHYAGTFGCHVTRFELLRSDGERMICSPEENTGMFEATIGGLGLTGLILWAEIKLKRIPTGFVDVEAIQFRSIDEFFTLSEESHDIEYTVSWVDLQASGKNFGRGVFERGDFYDPPLGAKDKLRALPQLPVPFNLPNFTVNSWTARIFNQLYFHKQITPYKRGIKHYNPFFYPLDIAADWYRVYGKRGFLQYQFVMDYEETTEPIKEILRRIARSGEASPLIVFKTFGDIESPGMLSFPRPGVTLALDFPMKGQETLHLLDELDQIVFENNGALYPAKDARMSPEHFRASFPRWQEFCQYIDPKFSSSFWRRVTEQ